MTGYASGYCSAVSGKEVYGCETMCVAKGDPYCYLTVRDPKAWGERFDSIQVDFCPLASGSIHEGAASLAREVERLREISRIQFDRLVEYAEKLSGIEGERSPIRARATVAADEEHFIAKASVMVDSLEQALRVAPLDMPVLAQGESGTGKEFLVHLIHQQGPRAKEPFVVLNCAALSESLLETELFGHVRGAFTGATQDKKGLLELAGKGSIFLDEIGELPISLQPKLLRAVENHEIRRVGGERCIRIDARILAATNRDLLDAIAAGTFRQDLYYRLAAFTIHLPSLREHTEDIPFLVQEFIKQSNARCGTNVSSVSSEAMSFLLHYPWPGNVCQLKHAIEHAVIVASSSVLRMRDFPDDLISAHKDQDAVSFALCDDIELQEQKLIHAALKRHDGKRSYAARELGISPVTLWRKIKRYNLSNPESRFGNKAGS